MRYYLRKISQHGLVMMIEQLTMDGLKTIPYRRKSFVVYQINIFHNKKKE